MKNNLNPLIKNFVININELRELLKLPEKFQKQAEFADKELDRIFLPITIFITKKDLKKTSKKSSKDKIEKYLKFLIDKYRKIEPKNIDKNGKILINIDKNYFDDLNYKKINKQRERFQYSVSNKIHIEKAVLFNLISYFEQLFSDILHIILKIHPEILQLNDKQLTFKEIQQFGTLDDAKNYLISQEIEKLLYQSLSNFLEFFEEKVFKCKFSDLLELKNELVEIKERRNLLIHNNGIVNTKYLKIVDKSLQEKYKVKKDSKIVLEKKYLKECIQKIELIGLEILSLASIKFQNEKDREDAIDLINEVIYDTFSEKMKNYFLGEKLSIFILNNCNKYLTDMNRDYFTLNYWHILKKQNRLLIVEDEITKYDTSSKNNIIKLCFFGLTKQYKKASEYIIPSLNEKDFSLTSYKKFPILEDLRKQKIAKSEIEKFNKSKKELYKK